MRARRILLIGIASLASLFAIAFAALQTVPGQRAVAGMISRMASGPDGGLDISGLSGFFPTDLSVAQISYRDREGPWLTVENARLRWSFASLLGGRLRIETISADRVAVLRPPLPGKEKARDDSGGSLRLPIGIDVNALEIADLHLAAALARVDSHWKLSGHAVLPADLAEGRVILTGDRLDGPNGRLSADVGFDIEKRTVDGEVSLSEKRGGLIAALLERPDIEDLSMRVVARGDARAGSAELVVSAGDAARANGKATWVPDGAATSVSVQLDAAGPGLPQGRIADAVREPVTLRARAVVDDQIVTLNELKLKAATLGVEGTARYDRTADRLEGVMALSAAEPGALAPFAGGVTWRGLRIETKADLSALSSRPQGTITITGGADDISLAAIDRRLPPLGAVTLAGDFGLGADGKITVRSLDIGSALASVKGGGSHLPSAQAGDAKITVALPDLAPLSELAGVALAGNSTVDLTVNSDRDGIKLGWQGTVSNVTAEGLPTELITAQVALSGAATWRFDEAWTLSDVRVASEGATLTVAGRGTGATGELDLTVELPKLDFLKAELGGAAKVTSNIRFGGERTELKLAAELNDLARGQIASRKLTLSATGSLDAAGAAGGEVKANGDLAGQPLSLDGRFALDAAGGVTVPRLQGRWASVALDVDDFAVTKGRTSGYARLRAANLSDASALAGAPLGGSLEAEITADDRAANGRVTVRVQGSDLRAGTLAIGTLDLRSTIDEPMTAGKVDATLAASRIAGAADINKLNATASGDRQALLISLQATGSQTAANATAKVELQGDDLVVGLTRFDGRYGAIPVALAGPTRVHVAGPRVAIEPTNLRVGGGRLAVRGTLAPSGSDLQLELAGLPLSLIDAFAPGTNLDGTLGAKLRVQGSMDAPVIDGTYNAAGLRLRRPEAALVPPLNVQGSGSLMGRQASIDARMTAAASNLTLKGKATLPRGAAPLSGTAAIGGTMDLAPFAPLLGNDIRNVTGRLRPDLTVEISGSRMTGNGSIDFSNGAVALPESGLRLNGGEGRLVLNGDTLQVQRLNFQTARGGGVAVTGTMRLDAQQGLVPDLTVTSRNALLVSRPDLVASVSSNIKVTGSTLGGLSIAGPVTIDRAEIAVGAEQSTAFPTLEVREINKPGVAATAPAVVRPAPAKPPPRAAPPPGAAPVRLALSIRAPRAVFVRGRGLDAEMSGQLEVAGTPAAPTVSGGLTMRRGDFTLLGRRLTFSRGVVTLDNLDRIDPRLDFVASTTVQSTTINVEIGGTSRAPLIAVTSVPSLPSDEAMALLLFGKPASGLSAFELAQAAQGLAELTGQASGTGMLTRLRTGLGLDRLSVGSGSGANSPVSLEAGRYVAPGVYVGARQGATGNSSRGVVQFDVLEHVKIEGDVGADSNGRVGVKMEWDY
ncbi:autotransporter secretion inner membrane protein TamB [Rhodospirillales bacterium URHD0017]|nr:autotransporter secretion inner membrane protein TamB [Rhodospirillales bacterium URHD0017]